MHCWRTTCWQGNIAVPPANSRPFRCSACLAGRPKMKMPRITTTSIISGRDDKRMPKFSSRLLGYILARLISALSAGMAQAADEEFPSALNGDIGLGGYYTRSIIRDGNDALSVLPYADFTYGRMFARVDTLGVKTLKLGYGHLELIGRISMDGFSTDTPGLHGLQSRENSLPLGIGTLQVTPIGGFWINAFHDVHRSRGDWVEAIYGGEFALPRVTF